MEECNTLSMIINGISALATLGSLIVGIIALVKINNYINQKRIDSINGFYSRLKHYLILLLDTLAVKKDKNNPLWHYTRLPSDISSMVSHASIKELRKYVSGVIELLLSANDQLRFKEMDIESFFMKIKFIQDIIYSDSVKIFENKEDADKYALDLSNLITDITQKISKYQEKYKG